MQRDERDATAVPAGKEHRGIRTMAKKAKPAPSQKAQLAQILDVVDDLGPKLLAIVMQAEPGNDRVRLVNATSHLNALRSILSDLTD